MSPAFAFNQTSRPPHRLGDRMPEDETNPSDQSELDSLSRPANRDDLSNQNYLSKSKNSDNMTWRQAMTTVGLALAIPWMIGVPTLIGWWIDKKFVTSPLWFVVGLVLGLVGTALDIYQLLKRFGQFK